MRSCAELKRDWFLAESVSSPRSTTMNFPLTILINLASTLTLIVLFCLSIKYIFQDGENGSRWVDSDGNWTFQMSGVEESIVEKILVDLGFLLFTNLLVFVKTCKVFNRYYDQVDLGGLAGCTFMFGQMLFVSFLYMLNIEAKDGEQRNQNNNNNNNQNIYWAMNEEKRRRRDQTVIACISLAFAILYCGMSFSVYCKGVSMRGLHREDTSEMQTKKQVGLKDGEVPLGMLANLWRFLAPSTVMTFGILLIATSCSLIAAGRDRLIYEGDMFNLIAILTWLLVISLGLAVLGRRVFSRQSSEGTLHIGLLAGGEEYFTGLLFLVSILYFSPILRNRQVENEHVAAIITSFACFLLFILHLGFSIRTKKHKRSISRSIAISEQESYIKHGDFVLANGGSAQMELA